MAWEIEVSSETHSCYPQRSSFGAGPGVKSSKEFGWTSASQVEHVLVHVDDVVSLSTRATLARLFQRQVFLV